MNAKSLTTGIAVGIVAAAAQVGLAQAVHINPAGSGQVLIYPYYTVNKSNSTLVSVVNSTDQTKAVKIRFLEGRNSEEVIEFNLYLSPFDAWTAAIVSDGPEGTVPEAAPPARLVTSDSSCTVPAIPAAGVSFMNSLYASGDQKVTGPWELSRTREGHLEIIEMGVLSADGSFANAVAHSAAGVPANCALLASAWSIIGTGTWLNNASAQIEPPSGGLSGGAEIVNPGNGTNLSYSADAIDGFFVSSAANLHTAPGSELPSLAQAQSNDDGDATAIVFKDGVLTPFPFTGAGAGLRAVSALFMQRDIYNEFASRRTANLSAQSEWVITFPTKRLHLRQAQPARLPFRSGYDIVAEGACEPVQLLSVNREGAPAGVSPIIFPLPPNLQRPRLCSAAQVLTFNQTNIGDYLIGGDRSTVLGAYYARNITTSSFPEGFTRMRLGDQDPQSFLQNFLPLATPTATHQDTIALVGLPVTGFWVASYAGTGTPGVLANYSIVHTHRADRLIENVSTQIVPWPQQTFVTSPVWRPQVASP